MTAEITRLTAWLKEQMETEGPVPEILEQAPQLTREEADRYAAALEDYTRPEPLPWSDFIIARGRALAAFGGGGRGEALLEKIEALRDEARRVGFISALAKLEQAIAGGDAEKLGEPLHC